MQKYLLAILLIFNSLLLKAQPFGDTVTFELNSNVAQYITVDTHPNNKWAIGHPDKTVFQAAYMGTNVIVTDTANPCSVNDTSIFTLNMPYYNGMSWYSDLHFSQWLDIDSGSTVKIEVLVFDDSGKVWINLTDTPYIYNQWGIGSFARADTAFFYKSTVGWEDVDFFIWGIDNYRGPNGYYKLPIDTVKYRFTFISSKNGKDGWMIDNIYSEYYYESVNKIKLEPIIAYPNPSNGEIYLKSTDGKYDGEISVFNNVGKEVYKGKSTLSGYLNLPLQQGIYTLKYVTPKGINVQQITILK